MAEKGDTHIHTHTKKKGGGAKIYASNDSTKTKLNLRQCANTDTVIVNASRVSNLREHNFWF